jgi:hypothetical protein
MTESTESARPVPPDQEPGDPELERDGGEATEGDAARDADAEAEEARVDAAPREVP